MLPSNLDTSPLKRVNRLSEWIRITSSRCDPVTGSSPHFPSRRNRLSARWRSPDQGLHRKESRFQAAGGRLAEHPKRGGAERAHDQDLAVHPGQDIKYVVINDEKSSRERIALAHEEIETYETSYYEIQLV